MECMRHCGIYVRDLAKMEDFYIKVFHMETICSRQEDDGAFIRKLTQGRADRILVTKLVTAEGARRGYGDMVELIEVCGDNVDAAEPARGITCVGSIHICMECDDIDGTMKSLREEGGTVLMPPFEKGAANRMGFACDPEGNYLELVERGRQ